jgi:hypothetical protein
MLAQRNSSAFLERDSFFGNEQVDLLLFTLARSRLGVLLSARRGLLARLSEGVYEATGLSDLFALVKQRGGRRVREIVGEGGHWDGIDC